MAYEVETRVYFNSYNECFTVLPWIKNLLHSKIYFKTSMYGKELFDLGKILRVSKSNGKDINKVVLGYKEKDLENELKYPLLLEIEKLANNIEEAIELEGVLKKFIDKYNLNNRVIKAEPLYLLK